MQWTLAAYVLVIVALGAIAVLALWAHLRYWVARLTFPLAYSEEDVLSTADGAHIELRRVPLPPGVAEQDDLPPVLLVHGIAANHRNQDIHPDYSLARHLAALGRDVWLLTLRSGRLLSRADRRKVRFDAMAQHDLPCAVDAVLKRTGRSELDYVGFSMGGMLLYAALGRSVGEARLRRVVIVASPGRVSLPKRLVRLVPRALLPSVPLRSLARTVAFASEWASTPFHAAVVNARNMPPGVTRLGLVNCIEDIPGALGAELVGWAAEDGAIRVNGERALDGLATVAVPALFIAGTADRIAPVAAVKEAFEAWGRARPETPKRFLVLGRDFGAHENYGHGDLVMGVRVAAELFEPIARFLGPDEASEAPGPETGAEALEEVAARKATAEDDDAPSDLSPT